MLHLLLLERQGDMQVGQREEESLCKYLNVKQPLGLILLSLK